MKNMTKTIKILVVEGDANEVDSLREALTTAQIINVEVEEVEDGDQALAYLRQEYPFLDASRPHLVFLGMNLPDMSGGAIIEELQKSPELKNIPVAVLTTSMDSERLKERHYATSHCYSFKKPTSCDEWIYVLRGIEDVWLTIKNIPGQTSL